MSNMPTVLNPIQEQIANGVNPLVAFLTMATCGDACWHAREEICRCSCGGKNHGCLNNGQDRPQRTARIGGQFYELVAVIPGPSEDECWHDAYTRTNEASKQVTKERFPGLDHWAYGEYRQEAMPPVLDRKISPSQAKWPEVAAIPNAYRLVWARPKGTRYLVKGPNHTSVYNDANGGSHA